MNIMHKITATLILLWLPLLVTGQGQLPREKYNSEAIYLETKFLRSYYVKDGKRYPLGGRLQHLEQELASSTSAAQMFASSKPLRRWGGILSLLGTIGIVGGIALANADNDPAGGIVFLSGVGVSLASIPFQIRAGNRTSEAIWLHNGDVGSTP